MNCVNLKATASFSRQSKTEHFEGAALMEYKCKEGFQDVNNHGKRQINATKTFCFTNGSINTALSDSCRRRPGLDVGNGTGPKCLKNGNSTGIPAVCQGIKKFNYEE